MTCLRSTISGPLPQVTETSAVGKYSEIVWLPMGRTASTSTNADVLTGLPNTYVSRITSIVIVLAAD